MSLFGGSAPPTHSPHDSDDSSFSSTRLSPSAAASPNSQNAQKAEDLIPLGANEDLDSKSSKDSNSDSSNDSSTGSDESEEEEEEVVRPNRFTGQPQTWQRHTAADRQIVESLDQIEDSDLAAHLFNAHALKRRLQRPAHDLAGFKNWQSRDYWLKSGKELNYIDSLGVPQKELVPTKEWTAWPMPPAEFLGLDDQSRHMFTDRQADEWTIGGPNIRDTGDDLREELLAVFLRLARENWDAREEADQDVPHESRTSVSRSQSRSRSVVSSKSARSVSRSDIAMKDLDHAADTDEEAKGTSERKRGRKPRDETFATPTILADDARAEKLLQPSIQSMMNKLDHLAMAVSRTRSNHFGRGGPGDTSSQSAFTSDAESSRPPSRSSSKARSLSAASQEASNPSSKQAAHSVKEGKRAGKARKDVSDSDSASSDVSEPDGSGETSRQRKRRRSSSNWSDSSASVAYDSVGREGLLDWSEVLGLAAVTGWDQEAIARTAQRCSNLFGESMSLMHFHEGLATKPVTEPVLYTPSLIPAPNVPSTSAPTAPKRPLFQSGTLHCPHTDCYAHEKDYELPNRVVEHCIQVHEYDPRTNDSDNEERKIGGVHIDGFLQPVTVKPGRLNPGQSKAGNASKKHKKGHKDNLGVQGAVESIEG